VIERLIEHELGFSGWDLRKTLNLLRNETVRTAIRDLVAEKRAGRELDRGPRIAPISDFIEAELDRWEDARFTHQREKPPAEHLNVLFREALHEMDEME
jgi:predicted nucleotidyltransferase